MAARQAGIAQAAPRAPIHIGVPIASPAQIARIAITVAACVLAVLLYSGRPAQAATSFDTFIAGLWPEAQARGVSRATFDSVFQGMTPDPSVAALTRKQAEFSRPISAYVAGVVTPARVAAGKDKASQWKTALAEAEQRSGVDASVIMGIWGIETNFGANTGGKAVLRSLATLAELRYRGSFFRDELLVALEIVEKHKATAEQMRGSWAGAMGQTQFMPSSYMRYAVDQDGDGFANIWTSVPDALGSTGNYLKQHGWIAGETWGYEVVLPKAYDFSGADKGTFATFVARGVTRADGGAMPTSGEASLLLPAGAQGPAFLLTPNFWVIKSYNSSTAYALAVCILADKMAGFPGIVAAWPSGNGLTPDQTKEVQRRLKAHGYDIGEVDGRIGDKARAAVRAYQLKAGMVADGHATLALLERMRKAH